jgi:hypothetical protein
MNLSAYKKTISALVTGLLGWGGIVVVSDPAPVSASEWLALGVALATALGVYTFSNEPTS